MAGLLGSVENNLSAMRLGSVETPEKAKSKHYTNEDKKAVKRSDYIEWEEFFILSAKVASMRSKDPSCQVGCVIVDKHKHIIGTGYNGFPIGCDDDTFPWGKGNMNPLENKYTYVVHAEANAILNKINNLEGCTLYTTTFPCNECAKLIIQSRIAAVVFLEDRTCDSYVASKMMFDAAKISYRSAEIKRDITLTLSKP